MAENGRGAFRPNAFDLLLILVVVAVALSLYRWLTVDYRVAPPYSQATTAVVATARLQLPRDHAWLCALATAGLEERNPRTGAPRARILGCGEEGGIALVQVELFGVRDGADRVLYRGEPLLPGRTIRVETATVLLEGVVRDLTVASPP